jgi:hypothetical protein
MTLMPRRSRQLRLCSRCGMNLNNGLTRWGLCYACELELEALSEGFDPAEIDTTESEIRRALSVLNFRGQFLNSVDDPDDSSADPT